MSEILNESIVLIKSQEQFSEAESLQDLEPPQNTKIATQLLPENVNFLSHKERTELFCQILNKMNSETQLKNNQNTIQFMVSYCLNQIDFFKMLARNFGSQIVYELMKLLKREDYARDEVIFEQGERNNKLYVIIVGSVMLYENSNEKESQGGNSGGANKKQVQSKGKQLNKKGNNKSNIDQKPAQTTVAKDSSTSEDNKQVFAGQALSAQIVLSDEDYFNPKNAKAVAVHNISSYPNHQQYQARSLLQSQSSICRLLTITRADFKRLLEKYCKQELKNRTLFMSNFTFLDSLSPRELLTLAINFDQMIFNRGDIVFEQDSQDISEIFFVKEGSFMLQIAVNEEQDDAQHVLRAKRNQKYQNIHPLGENTLFGVEGLNVKKVQRYLEDMRRILQTEKDGQDEFFSDKKGGRSEIERIKELMLKEESQVPRRIGRVVCESTRGCVFRVKISSILSYLSIEEERQKLSVLCDSLLETQTTKILDLVDVQVSNRRETEEIKKQSKYIQPAVEFIGMKGATINERNIRLDSIVEGEEQKKKEESKGLWQRRSFSAQMRGIKSEENQQKSKRSNLRNRRQKMKTSQDEISIKEHLDMEDKKRQMRQCSPIKKTDQKVVQIQTIKQNQDQFQKDWNQHFSNSSLKNKPRSDSQGCQPKHSDTAYITENINKQRWFNRINSGDQVKDLDNKKISAIHESIEKHEQEDYDESSKDSNGVASYQGILRELSDLNDGSYHDEDDDQGQKKLQTQGEQFLKQLFYFCGERNERIAKENSLHQLKMSFLGGDKEQSKRSVVIRNNGSGQKENKKSQVGRNQNENCCVDSGGDDNDNDNDDDSEQAKNLEEYLRRKLIHKLKDSQIDDFNRIFGQDIIEMSKANNGSSEYEQRVINQYYGLKAQHTANFKNIAEIVRNLNYSYSQVREFFNKLNHKDRFFQDIFLKANNFPDVAAANQRDKWGNVITGDDKSKKRKHGQEDKNIRQSKELENKNDVVGIGKSRLMLRKNLINKLSGQEQDTQKGSQLEEQQQQRVHDQPYDDGDVEEKIEQIQEKQIQAAKDTMNLLQVQAEKQAELTQASPRKVVVVVRQQQKNSKGSINSRKNNNAKKLIDSEKASPSSKLPRSTQNGNLLQSFSCSTRMNSSSSSSSFHGLFNLSSSAFHSSANHRGNKSTKNTIQGLSYFSASRPNTSPANHQTFSLEMQNNSDEMNLTLPDHHINRNKYTKIPKQFRKQQKQDYSLSSLASSCQKQSIGGGQETCSNSQGLFPLKEGSCKSSTHSLMGQIKRNCSGYAIHNSDGFQVVENGNVVLTGNSIDSNSIKLHGKPLMIQGTSKIDVPSSSSASRSQRSPASLKMNKTQYVPKTKKEESMNIFPIQENYFKRSNSANKHIQRGLSAASNGSIGTTNGDSQAKPQNELVQQTNSMKKQINPAKIFLSLSPSSPKKNKNSNNWEEEEEEDGNEGDKEQQQIEADYHQKGFRRNRSVLSSTKAVKNRITQNLSHNQTTENKNNIIKRASSVQHQREQRSSILKNNYNDNNDSTQDISSQPIQQKITLQPYEQNENQQIYVQNRSRSELNSIILSMQRDLLLELKKTTKGIDRTSPHVLRQKLKQAGNTQTNAFLQIQPLTQNLSQDINVQYQQQTPSPPPPLPAVFTRKTAMNNGSQRNSSQV